MVWSRHVVGLCVAGSVLLAAGCGGGSKAPPVASVTTTPNSPAGHINASRGSGSGSGTAGPTPSALLAYSQCMRSNGVTNFPDPNARGQITITKGGGIDPSSPLFRAAQTKCQKLIPGGGLAAPGSTTHPTAQAFAQMLQVSRCMRQHGVSAFPDPTTTVPSHLTANMLVSDRDGVILVFPGTIDMQSPLFTRAAAACRFQVTNH
jgi:hypothetical protein